MSLYNLNRNSLKQFRLYVYKYTFVSLPTDYGKSAIYVVLPLAFDCFFGMLLIFCYLKAYVINREAGKFIVISPVTFFMMDQRQ